MHSDVYPDHDIGLRQILGVEKFVKVNLQISSVQILERLEEVGAPVAHMRDFDSFAAEDDGSVFFCCVMATCVLAWFELRLLKGDFREIVL
jgi:hypothetical protein